MINQNLRNQNLNCSMQQFVKTLYLYLSFLYFFYNLLDYKRIYEVYIKLTKNNFIHFI